MAELSRPTFNVQTVKRDDQITILERYASSGSLTEAGKPWGLHPEVVRRIVRSPQGSFQLEQILRDRNRQRAVRIGAVIDRSLDELATALDRGNEQQLRGRQEGEPRTIFVRPDVRDLSMALTVLSGHMRDLVDSLNTVDVSEAEVTLEARQANLEALRQLVSQEERHLARIPATQGLETSDDLEASSLGDDAGVMGVRGERTGHAGTASTSTFSSPELQPRACAGDGEGTAAIAESLVISRGSATRPGPPVAPVGGPPKNAASRGVEGVEGEVTAEDLE